MNEYAGVNIRLSREEYSQLTQQAQRELRHPRDHARYLLRQALGLTSEDVLPQQAHNRAGAVSQAVPSAIAG